LPNATSLVVRILEEWEQAIDAIEVVPGTGGIFDVHLDGELLFTKAMLGRYPEPEDVLPLLREQID
jgi:selenoprotein W-related protein